MSYSPNEDDDLDIPLDDEPSPKEVPVINHIDEVKNTDFDEVETKNNDQIAGGSKLFDSKEVRILIGTWNVSGKAPSESLEPWIFNAADTEPDFVVVGLQECVELKAENVLEIKAEMVEHFSKIWEQQVENALYRYSSTYVKLLSKQLIGIFCCIYAKIDHMPYVHDVRFDNVGVGVMKVMGNKGAVAIRFKFYDSSLCFVCSHLAAGGQHTDRRNQDYQTIISKIAFSQKGSTKTSSILEHGHIFWFGDLNYRIDLKLTAIMPAIQTKNIKGLLKKEQLIREKSAGKVFIGFKEGPITFLPTYKYQANTDIYDEKKTPAYCDRILWRGDKIKQLRYSAHSEPKCSDHRPVSSMLVAEIRIMGKNWKEIDAESVIRKIREEQQQRKQVFEHLTLSKDNPLYTSDPEDNGQEEEVVWSDQDDLDLEPIVNMDADENPGLIISPPTTTTSNTAAAGSPTTDELTSEVVPRRKKSNIYRLSKFQQVKEHLGLSKNNHKFS